MHVSVEIRFAEIKRDIQIAQAGQRLNRSLAFDTVKTL